MSTAELLLSDRDVYSARPTVRVNGSDDPALSELIRGMETHESIGGMASAELKLTNVAGSDGAGADLAVDGLHPLNLGAAIEVYCGDEAGPREVFRGQVTGLEANFPDQGPPELTVLAEDLLQHARMARRTRTWEDVSIAELARDLAKSLALTPVVHGFDSRIGPQVQLGESDLAFLRRVLARYDGDLQVVGRELQVSPRSDVARGTVTLAWGSQLRSARVLADLSAQATEVTVSGWDAKRGRAVVGKSRGAHLQPGRGTPGSEVLRQAIGPRPENVGHMTVATESEAQALADAEFDRRARRFLRVEAVAEGNPLIRVGTVVNLSGLGRRFDNAYYVVEVRHRYDLDSSGYTTEFEAECPYLGL